MGRLCSYWGLGIHNLSRELYDLTASCYNSNNDLQTPKESKFIAASLTPTTASSVSGRAPAAGGGEGVGGGDQGDQDAGIPHPARCSVAPSCGQTACSSPAGRCPGRE